METKIGPQYQDMFDNLFIEYSKNIVPEMWNLGLTPNNVTTLSLIFGLVSAIMLHNGNYLIFGILHLISYILDTCDGMMARKYNLTSDFGDKYDHFKDWFVGIILLFLFLKKFPISKNVCSYSIGIFLVIISFIHVGCKEKIYKKNGGKSSNMLSITQHSCVNEDEIINYVKYFGLGTLNIYVAFLPLIISN